MYELFDDPYIYGPLTKNEYETIAVNHRMTVNENGYYIGVSREIPQYEERQIHRPVHITNPTPENNTIEGEFSVNHG